MPPLTSLLLTYELWGTTAVIIGLVLLGIGIVPVALLAALFHGHPEACAEDIGGNHKTSSGTPPGFADYCKRPKNENGYNQRPEKCRY